MQYPTPQFIEEEGKIIAFLTFKQFWMVVIGGFLCLGYFLLLRLLFAIVLAGFTALITFVVAFIKLNNMSVTTVLMNFIGFATKSKTYTWKKKEVPYPFKVHKKPEPIAVLETAKTSMKMQHSALKDVKTKVETRK